MREETQNDEALDVASRLRASLLSGEGLHARRLPGWSAFIARTFTPGCAIGMSAVGNTLRKAIAAEGLQGASGTTR